MNIRALELQDIPTLHHVETALMQTPWSAAQLDGEVKAACSRAWVIENGSAIVGYAFFRHCFPECELLRLGVSHPFQRQGLGRSLLTHGLQHFLQAGYATCFLEVRASNQAARQLYAQSGFVENGKRINYYSHPLEDALLLVHRFSPFSGALL